MSLLPKNEAKELHKFDEALAERWQFDIAKNPLEPLLCDKKYLPFIAKAYDMDISLLDDATARTVLKTAIMSKNKVGTSHAVKSMLKTSSMDIEILEWFKTKSEPYTFKVKIFLTDDLTQTLQQDDFTKSKKLIERTKNVRSKFESFIIDMTITAEIKVSSVAEPLRFRPFMNINELIINNEILINSGWVYEATAKSVINENITLNDTNIQGGYTWQVEV